MAPKNASKTNGVNLANAVKLMFKNMKSGNTIYLAFSRRDFHILTFVMAMSVIGNAVLVKLLIDAPTMVQRASTPIFAVQFILSSMAIIAGFWLFLRGVDIITEK